MSAERLGATHLPPLPNTTQHIPSHHAAHCAHHRYSEPHHQHWHKEFDPFAKLDGLMPQHHTRYPLTGFFRQKEE